MSFLYGEATDPASAFAEADGKYGPIDFVSEPLPFGFTDYYEEEMGPGLRRRLIAFRPLIPPEGIVDAKLWTNSLEEKYLNSRRGRTINVDPGVLAAAKFILATGKDYTHRIYLGKGIFGDLTLIFRNGAFTPLPWTYPDYASEPLSGIIGLLRRQYLWQIKQGQKGKWEKGEEGKNRW